MTSIRERTDDFVVDTNNGKSLLKPDFLSHGTLECKDFRKSRVFYEDFLGLECVQHGPRSMCVRCGMKFHIVCLQVGDAVRPLGVNNHWGLDLASREDVAEAHNLAQQYQEKFGIRSMTDPVDVRGVFSFYIEDLDSNWWELQYFPGGLQDDVNFDFGDRFNPDGTTIDS